MSNLDSALEYLDQGWSVIPIHAHTKKPAIEWKEYQSRQPTEEEVEAWWATWPHANIAIITGHLSGVVIVDCDNERALAAAKELGFESPISVRTRHGRHFYWAHPRDGTYFGNRAGSNSRGVDWPKVPGLDFRGDGGYALLPPSKSYSWEIAAAHDFDDMPEWSAWKAPPAPPAPEDFGFEHLDLSGYEPLDPDQLPLEWERTRDYVREHYPATLKLPTGEGNARNERVMRHVSDCICEGVWGDELAVRARSFMREFFEDELPEREVEATIRSMMEAERRNHPEHFNEAGEFIGRRPEPEPEPAPEPAAETPPPAPARPRLIVMSDGDALIEAAGAQNYLIHPWLPAEAIVQVYGYSGHGKSLFVQHCMAALTTGWKYFGPFEMGAPADVLYLDYEMGRGTIGRRMNMLRQMYGDAGERFQTWSPSLRGLPFGDLNLRTAEGRAGLQSLLQATEPQVVIIDTVRSGYLGLKENDAEAWSEVNSLAVKIRNAGCAVILIHHSNKPGDDGLGREAGSTNQLTVIETQIRITQVYEDKDMAKRKAGIADESYDEPVFPQLQKKAGADWLLRNVMEVSFGKVREWTDEHDPAYWLGFCEHFDTQEPRIVSSSSTKQKARAAVVAGMSVEEVAKMLNRPMKVIREWVGVPAHLAA